MRTWTGIKDSDTPIAGDDALDGVGLSFLVEKELRRRPGLTKICAAGGRALGAFRSAVAGVWIIIADASGNLKSVNLAIPSTITTLKSSYDTAVIPTFNYCNGRLYVTNNFDAMQVWNGIGSAFQNAGIAAPTAAPGAPVTTSGTTTVGTHLLRYRYLDNTSPASTYRSNVSALLSQAVASAADGTLTFNIGTAVSTSIQLVRSTDAKVTTIQLEMTAAAGSTYYVVGTVNNASTAVAVNITDTNLVLGTLGGLFDSGNTLSTDDLGTGNEQPPLGTIITQCRDYLFLGGDEPYALAGVTATLNSTTITGAGFSILWNAKKVIRIGTDTTAYQISVVSSSSSMTLANAYTGATVTTTASVYSQNPNAIYWSAFIASRGAVMPESWRAAVRSRSVLNGTGDILRGMCAFNGDLMIFGKFTSQRLVFVDDPGAGEIDELSGQFGIWNQRCLIKVEGTLYGWGPNGAWSARGGMPQWISRDIETTYGAIIDTNDLAQFHGAYDPATKTLRWFYTNTTNTSPKQVIAIDLPGQRWTRETYRQGIDASLFGADSTGKIQCIMSDATQGYTFYRAGATDGVPSSSSGSYTVNTGSTTTITQVTDSLPTGALTDLAGLIIYDPVSGEERAITSNTVSAITHAAFTAALTAGSAAYVGAIPWTYETNWWIGDGLEQAKRPDLFIEVFPGSTTGIVRVTFYADWSSTAVTFTTASGYTPPKGVSQFNNGQAYLEADFGSMATTDGFIKFPMPMDWRRSVRCKLEILNPAGTLHLLDVYWALQGKRDSMNKVTQQ